MLPLPKGAAPKFILLFLVSLLIKEISSEGRVVCYYTNWSVYRPGTAKFNPQNINPYLCTHLIYAFGGFTKDNTLKPFDKYQDIEQGGYSKFTGLKAYNKNLKTLLAIGGWNEGSSRFSPLVASPERRQQFIKNTLKFLRQNHFDGLDLDWEYPAFRDGGKSRDKDNYAQFVQELRSEFDRESSKTGRPRLLLTMAVPAGTEYIEKGYDIPKLNRYLDWFNLLSYDYHSAYEPSVNHHSPLYSLEEESEYNYDGDLNIDYSIKFYLEAGADRDKLVLGIPTYGRTYTLVSEDITDLGSPADGPGSQGDATREKGYLAYYEICQNLRDDPDWTVVQPNSKAMGPYAFRGDQWVGYDDEAIVKKKAEYVVENGLGGIMFWSIDNDDFRGSCGKKPYPLIEAAKEAMLDRLGVGDNEVARPSSPRKPSRSRSRQGSSNRNNIISEISTHKSIQSRKKSSSRRNSNKKRLNRVTSPTTTTTTTTPSSLYIGGRTTTPPPPTTPDPGSDFKCEEEGFFPHPRDCKKYFWCLDSGPSNLGIVAHQFTCPSGLYFNTAADSCDFSRNVLCKTKTTTEKPTTSAPITTSTTTTTTTTNSPRITAATSRQSFLRYSSTTEQSSEEEEYDDDEDDERAGPEEEEDPRVIKELIQLIKKVGGLEELEKQLLQQEDGSMVLTNSKSDVSSTTASTISKSLYHKVLSRPNNLSSFRRQFETNKLTRSTVSPASKEEDESVEVEESSKKVDSRYSSVVRNSRPSPQNEGIDKLPEFEGFLKEKPKYVTIQRTKPTIAVVNRFDEEEDEDVSTEFVEQSTRDSKNRRVDSSYSQTTTSTPSYVNIRRTRPSTAAPETSEVTEEEKVISSTRSSYQPLNRRRISTVTTATDEITILPSTGTPLISTTQRYKTIERTKSSTIQPEEIKTTTGFSSTNSNNVDENAAPITVQNLELNEYTTQAPIQKIATTHIYENIARRTTLSTTHPSTLVETTTAEPTTIRAFTTTNPTTTTISSSTNSAPLLEQDPNPVDNFQNQNLILPITDPSPNKSTGLDTDGKYTTELTDKNTDSIHQIGEDEVTLTDSKVKVSSSSTLSSYNLTKFNELESSLKATNPSLSKIEKQVTVTSTDILTTPNTDATTTETTIQKDELTTKDILETVSSPRPFGFPRRRTRPTAARKPSSTTNHEIVTSTSTVTPPPTQKVSPLKQFKSNSRTTSRYQSRTYVEDVSSASNNARELNEVGKGNTNTSQTPPKRPLNTYSHSGENADDEFDNSISSRKRSYSWRSQVDRRFRPWQTTTTVKTTPLPLVGPDRSYRPQYGDERDNLETDDSYVSYRGESESDSSSSTNKARQFERNRGFVRTSSDDVASERRIGARLQNSGGAIEETQKSNRRHRVQAGSNSYRQKSHRTQSEFDSSLSQDDANFEKNRGNTQTSSENASSRKRLGVRLQNPRVALDESKETQKSNRTYGIRGETQSSDNNSDRNKSHRADSEASTLSSKDDASFGRSSGTFQTSSKDEASQRRIESQTDSSLSIKDGVETTSEDVTSKRKIGVQLRNGISTTSTSEGTRSSNRRYGVGTETQSADKNSYRQKSFRVQSESDSSLSSNGDTSFEGSRGNLQTSSQDEISQKQIETGSESSLSVKDNNQRNSQDVTSQRRIGVRLQSESSTASASEDIRSNHRTYGAESENKSADNNSNRHKSHRVEFESESTLSSKDDTNLHQSRDNLQTTTEDELSQKGIESETESSLSIKDDIQTSSQDVTSQRKIGVRFRDETGASEGIRSSNQRYGVETENQSTDDSYRRKSHRVISGSETSSGNTEDTTSKSKIGSRFRKPDTFINESEEVRQSNRRYGVHVDQNKFSDDSYRHKSNRVVSESSDSTLSTNEESDHSNQRITTGNISHKRIGIRLRNPTTINDSAEIRKSNRKYGAERGVETSFEGNNEDSSKAKTIETSKTTTVYELLNKNTLPSQVVTQNITRYYSSKTNLHGNDNVETISIDDSQVDNSNTNGISESTTNVQDHGNQLGLHANFQVGTSGVSAIKSKTDSKATHTFINASELTRENNTLTDSITHENTNEQSSQTKLVKGLNEAEAVSHAHSDQFTNTNIKQINEEGVDSSGKSDVRQYYTSAEDDSNTIAALHQGKIKLGNQEKTTFVRNKAAVNLYTQGTHSDGESTQFLSSKSNKEEHSINLEDIDGRKSSSTAEKISEELNTRQSNGLVDASKQTWQTVEGQNGNNNSRRRVVVRKRIYRGRNNNTDESSTEGRRVTNFSSATSNSATGNRGYKQGTKATLNRNTAGVEDLSKVQVSNTLYGRKVTESSITTSGNDASENVSNEESEATGAKEDNNALSGLERFSQRRIQTSRNFGTANNIHRNSISSTRRRITNTEEKSTAQDAQLNDNTEISGNEERNKVRLRQRIRPTRPVTARTNPPERKTRPYIESELSSLLAIDRKKWEFLDKTKMPGGGTMVRRRRPVVKASTEIPTDPETTKTINRRVRPLTSINQSTDTVRQRTQFLYRNKGSETASQIDENSSVNTQSERNSLRGTSGVSQENEKVQGRVVGNSFTKLNSTSTKTITSSVQNEGLGRSRTSEESLLVITSGKGSESAQNFIGNRKMDTFQDRKTTTHNELDEEVDSKGEILSFEESQNGSFRGRSQNALKSSTLHTLKTNKAEIVANSKSLASIVRTSIKGTSGKSDESEISSTTISSEDSTTVFAEMDPDKDTMTTTEESSTLIPHTTFYNLLSDADFSTTINTLTTTDTQTTIEPPTTTDIPTTMDAQEIYTSTTVDTPTTEMELSATTDTPTTMDTQTTMDTPTTINSHTTINTPTETTTLSDSSTEGDFENNLENLQLNIGETTRFADRTSEKAKTFRSFQSTRQQNTFQTEKDSKQRQSSNVNRKFGAQNDDEDVQQLRGKDGVEILYHRKKYWETFNKTRADEADSPIIYVGTFGGGGYTPGRTGKFSPTEIQKIQEIFTTEQQTESFSDGLTNINHDGAKFSRTGSQQNVATVIDENKEIRLTTTKDTSRIAGSLIKGSSGDLTRSQVLRTKLGRGKSLSSDDTKFSSTTDNPNLTTIGGNAEFTTIAYNSEDTTINADNLDVTMPQTTENINEESATITEDTLIQTTDFGMIDQKDTLTSTLSFGEEETTIFPPLPTATDKTTNALHKTSLSAFENNLSATTDGFVDTSTNSNLFFSEKSPNLAQSTGEISSKFNSAGFSKSRTRISTIQQGSSKGINEGQANEISDLDLNLKVNVSKDSTVSSNTLESKTYNSRTSALSKTNSLEVNKISEESTAEEGLQVSGGRYTSSAGRNLRVSNLKTNRRQFAPSSKRKQPNSSAESTEATVTETATESSSTPSETGGTTIRSTLIFLKGPRPDGRYAEEFGQDTISSFQRGSSFSTGASSSEENDEDHRKDLLYRSHEGGSYSRFHQGNSHSKSTSTSEDAVNWQEEDSLFTATENEGEEETKTNGKEGNENEEVSTIRSTLIFLKGPFQTSGDASTVSGIEDTTELNEPRITDSSQQTTPTRRTYVALNRSKTTHVTAEDSSLTHTAEQNEDRRSEVGYRGQQSYVEKSYSGDLQITPEHISSSVNTSDDEESINSGESDLSLNNRGTLNRKTYSTIDRERVKRPLQSSLETTSELNVEGESSTLSPSTISPSQGKPTRRRYSSSLRLRSTTTAPELATEVTEQKLETTTEKNESVRRYSSFRRKSSSKEGFTRKGRISSEEESEKKVEGDSIISNSNSEREVENEAETSQENDLENNDLKSRSTYSRRNFTSRLQSSSGRIGSQRTKSYGSVKLNDVTEIDDLAEKTYSSVNSGIGETKGFGGSKKSEQSSTEEESSILRTEGITEYTTILPEIRDVTPELSTEENVVTQATTTELEEGSAMTEQNSENLDDLEIKKTTVQNEEVESKTLTASEGKSKINEEQTTTAAAEDNNLKMSTEINKAKLNTREQTGLRFNRVRTSNTNKNSENIVNISSKIAEAAKTQTISSTRGSNESNRYRIGGARKIYETNSRRKVTTLKKGKLGEERTTTFSAEDGTSVPESVENDLFASSPSPDSLVTETIEFTANTNFNSDEDNQATTSDYFTTLSTFSIADQDKEEMDDPTTFDPNFSTTESNEMLDKIKEEENTSDVALTILEDDLAETTYPAISGDKEEVSTINETSTKQTEDTIVTVIPKKPSLEGGKFGIARTRLESVTKNEDKSSTNEESSEKLTTGARTYSSFNRNRLLLKTNQRINEESTGSGFSTSSNGGSSISEYRKRYGTNGNSRTKSIQTGSKNQAVDQKSAPAYSFSTRTRAKLPLRQNLEKSINANQNDLSSSEDRTSQSENEENSSLSEFTKVESEGNEKKLFTNSGIEFNLEEENSTISTGRIDEDQTEYRDEYQGNQNYSESSDNMKVEDYVGSKTTSLDNADNFEADIYLESNSSTSTEKSEDTKNRLVRPLPYLKSKNTFQNRQNTLKLGQNTVIEDEVRKKQSKEVLTYSERSTNISDETRTNVDESEETSVRQSAKTTSQLKFQRKPFPLSRNLPKTLREKSTNETESSIRESHKSINIESNQEESSVTNLSQEVTELHATLNEEHSPELLDSTNSTALNVNNSANNGLVREDSIDNNETSNPLKFNRRFQKISSGNRFQLNNNQNTESTVRTVNGRRVRVVKFRKPSINTVPDSEGKVNDITSQRPLVRKYFRKRPSAIATTLVDTESSAEYRENLNEARDAPTKKFRKILVRKTPVYQEDTEEELQDLQVNSTKSTFIPIKSSEGKTRFLKVNSSEDSIDLDLQNEFSDTNTTSSHNISTTEEIAENSSYNITSTAEITQNAFADTEFNATSVESIEQTGGENITTTESEEQNMNTESVESAIQENGENITTTENEEQNINTESVESTVVTSTTKNKLFATRRPYKPTKPSISAITSTEAASATTKTYVRKYSSNFKIPKPPTEIHTNIGSNDENGEVFIRPLSSFIKNRPTYQNKVNTLNDGNEDDDDVNVEDGEEQREEYFERNLQEQHDRDAYVADSVEDIQDEKEEIRDENEELKYEKEGIREDEEIIDEKEEPAAVPIFRPPVLQTVNRINTKSSGLPNLIIRLNNGFDSQSEKSELEVVPHSSEEQTDSASASYEDEEEANIDQTAEDEFQSVEKVDLPIPSNTPQVQTTKATPLINHPGFVPKRPQNNKPRVINRPTFTTVHPASLKFRVTSVLASTPPSFKTNNTRSYERKYSPSSTEPTSQDNSLIEDLNIDALNARNKKIFETNSRKHTTVKPKPTGGKTDTSESETTSNISHNVDQINATTNEILNNFDHLQENVLENVIPPPTTTRRPPPSTTTTKMTTLYHIFALSAEDDATTENNSGDELITNERREKLVEINRVVEVYSKEDKLKKSKNNDGERIESSELKLEKNATLERLGEIGRVSFVKFVDSSGGKAKSLEDRGELIIEGRSTVADYTPTEPISAGSESGPVRNAIPSVDGTDQTEKKKEARKLQLPEVILGVETSTIPLEGLFEAPRKSKELPVSDEPVFASSLGEVYAMKTETSSVEPTIATTNIPTVPIQDTSIPLEMTTELPLTTVTEVKTEKPQNYIRPLVPLLRPESNESSPLVISIANLDKVILSKVPRSDSSVASSGRISTFIEPPKSINLLDDASLSTMKSASSSQGRNETVVQTQTSFSSEIQVVRKKVPRRSKSTRRRKPKVKVEEQTN